MGIIGTFHIYKILGKEINLRTKYNRTVNISSSILKIIINILISDTSVFSQVSV